MAASENTFLPIPQNKLKHYHTTRQVGEILSEIDLEHFERATTKYRKPSYQRMFHKPDDWQISLIESLLRGMTIGPVILSRWVKQSLGDNEEPIYEEFYNIEDGQTRLSALLNFRNGNLKTIYGTYQDVSSTFDAINLQIVQIERAHPRIRDSEYFAELCLNFQYLQESTPLSASDRYWAAQRAPDFPGSPLVNLTIELLNGDTYRKRFNDFMGFPKLSNRSKSVREKLANAVAIISCAWKGLEYANTKYYNHAPIMFCEISEEDKGNIINVLKKVFSILSTTEIEYARQPDERPFSTIYNNPSKFLGNIMNDIRTSEEDFQAIRRKWVNNINQIRKESLGCGKTVQKYLDENVYINLTTGNKRNCSQEDFQSRLDAINEWCR